MDYSMFRKIIARRVILVLREIGFGVIMAVRIEKMMAHSIGG